MRTHTYINIHTNIYSRKYAYAYIHTHIQMWWRLNEGDLMEIHNGGRIYGSNLIEATLRRGLIGTIFGDGFRGDFRGRLSGAIFGGDLLVRLSWMNSGVIYWGDFTKAT